jgi:hypothetical protein
MEDSHYVPFMSGLAQWVQRWAMDWTAGVRFPAGVYGFSLLHNVQAGSRAHTASSSNGYQGTTGSRPLLATTQLCLMGVWGSSPPGGG